MRESPRNYFLSSLLGGLVVLGLGALLIGTGVIDTGKTERIVQQTSVPVPSESLDGSSDNNDNNSSNTASSTMPTVEEIYQTDSPGVVFIQAKVTQQSNSPFGFSGSQQGTATGSGFVIDKKGDILTNAHVVEGASEIGVRFGDSDLIKATVVGKDPSTDLALLRVNPKAATLHPLTLGDSSTVNVGDPAIAIGNPFGFDRTVTTGIVSALQRQIQAPNNFTINNVIQTDAAINPGNSGGPLLDASGRVIGITSQIATGTGGNGSVGIGFAIPINTARAAIPQLEKSGKVAHAFLGVTTAPITSADAKTLKLPTSKGALVQDVTSGSPAAKAGIKAGSQQTATLVAGGDLIVKVGATAINKPDDISTAISSMKPGQKVVVQFYRGGKLKSASVTLGNRPASVESSQSLQTFPFP
jgi:S1-C subfamily serine protease